MGALYALQEAGKRVPDDISIAGFDDLRHSKQVWPGLTTVKTPFSELVEQAMLMLITMLNNHPPKCRQVLLPTRLIERRSTARIQE